MDIKKLEETYKEINEWVNNDDIYAQVFYDFSTSECWCKIHCDFTRNTFSRYHDDDIISCGTASRHISLASLQGMIESAVAESDFILSQTGMR